MLNIKSYKDFIGCLYNFDSEPTIIETEEDAMLFFHYVDTVQAFMSISKMRLMTNKKHI